MQREYQRLGGQLVHWVAGFEKGTEDYLTKPFNRLEIRVRVRNLVE